MYKMPIIFVLCVLLLGFIYLLYSRNALDIFKRDVDVLSVMKKGFIAGVLEEGQKDIEAKETKAIEDIFTTAPTDGSAAGTTAPTDGSAAGTAGTTDGSAAGTTAPTDGSVAGTDTKRKKFYEGAINWKFTDVNPSTGCWEDWDYINKGVVLPVKLNAIKDGRMWCATNEPTPSNLRGPLVPPETIMDKVNSMTGNGWGLAGAIGLGLTEEILTKLVQKSSKEAVEKAAKKASAETAERLLKKVGKELNEEVSQKLFKESAEKLTKEITDKAEQEALESASVKLKKELIDSLDNAVNTKYSKKITTEINERVSSEMKDKLLSFGKKSVQSLKDDLAKKLASQINSKSLNVSTDVIKNLVKNRVNNVSLSGAKSVSSAIRKKIITKVSSEVQQLVAKGIYKGIVTKFSANITEFIARKLAKAILAKVLIKAQLVTASKVFFKMQAKMFMSIGKTIAKSGDNIAKAMIKLAALSKSIGKSAMKSGFKVGMRSAAKFASKMKPGPMAIFDIMSMTLDMIDPMDYNSFMSTKDFKAAMEKSNTERKDIYIKALLESDAFKDSGLKAADIAYPSVLDPIADNPAADDDENAQYYVEMLFRMAKVSTPHPSLNAFINKLNADIASGVLTDSPTDAQMDTYSDLVDTESIISIMSINTCKKLGGQVYDTDKCTYTKASCDSMYSWPVKDGETYGEYKDGICIAGNPEVRAMCDTIGAKWDIDNYQCKIDKAYCTSKGGEMDANNNCAIPVTQEVIEFILGTTVTRVGKQLVNESVAAVKGIFDFFYEGCGYDGEIKIRGKCMDNNDGVRIWDCNGSGPQKWMYNSKDKTIRSMTNFDNCLDMELGAKAGSKIHMVKCNGSDDQKWVYDENSKQLKAAVNNTLCADLNNDNDGNGTGFNLLTCKTHRAQTFDMKRNYITDTGMHCSITDSRTADCPPSFTNTGLLCGRSESRKSNDFGHGKSEKISCPDGWYNNGTSCARDYAQFTRDSYNCAFQQCKGPCDKKYGTSDDPWPCTKDDLGLRAYPNCRAEARVLGRRFADEYTNRGAFCDIQFKTESFNDVGVCPDKYTTKTGMWCFVNCEDQYGEGYYNDGQVCYRGPKVLGEDSQSCQPWERKIAGVCYPKVMPGFTDLGLTQSRKKNTNQKNVDGLKSAVNTVADALEATYN
jgi:hypothetical protein